MTETALPVRWWQEEDHHFGNTEGHEWAAVVLAAAPAPGRPSGPDGKTYWWGVRRSANLDAYQAEGYALSAADAKDSAEQRIQALHTAPQGEQQTGGK